MDTPIRKSLCADSLISTIFQHFQKISDPRGIQKKSSISFTDVLMSGFAVFGLKFPSLLQYDQNRQILDQNLLNLYHISRPPSGTYLRERLDELEPSFIRPSFKKIFARFQRGKCLEGFEFLDEYYLLSLDGTGEFSSGEICCPQCGKKEYKDGSVTYYHQMLGAKPGDHEFLFNAVEESEETKYYDFRDKNVFFHQFRYLNNVALNKSNQDVRVNFLEYM